MSTKTADVVKTSTRTAASGAVREKMHDLRERVEPPLDEFTVEAADRVESVAEQIRALGERVDRASDANRIARRLERTADYLRYRPPGRMARDSWEVVRDSNALWIAGGLVATAGLVMLLRSRRD